MESLGRTSLTALAVLAAALALAACGSSSDATTAPDTGRFEELTNEQVPGEEAVVLFVPPFAKAEREAAASGVPVRIANKLLEHPPGGADHATVLRSPPDSYTLGISTDPGCRLKGECTAAIFSGFSGGGELTGKEVKLNQGIKGVYEPGRCGPGCKFGTIEWIQDGNRYGLAVAKVPQSKLVEYVNEAIDLQPLH
jgi:hypothetical protein